MFDTRVKKNPRVTIETVMQSVKVHVCCSMSESRVIDLYSFDDDTIKEQNCLSMLKKFVAPELKRLGKATCNFSAGWSTTSF